MRALIFDLDGTLVDTVYAHVFAWQRALLEFGPPIDGWRIHRRIGMSGGLFARAVAREIGRELTDDEAERSSGATARSSGRSCPSGGRCRARSSSWPRCATAGVVHGIATSGRRPEIDLSLEALGVPPKRSSSSAATSCGPSPSRTCSSPARSVSASRSPTATSSATPSGTCSPRGGPGCSASAC